MALRRRGLFLCFLSDVLGFKSRHQRLSSLVQDDKTLNINFARTIPPSYDLYNNQATGSEFDECNTVEIKKGNWELNKSEQELSCQVFVALGTAAQLDEISQWLVVVKDGLGSSA